MSVVELANAALTLDSVEERLKARLAALEAARAEEAALQAKIVSVRSMLLSVVEEYGLKRLECERHYLEAATRVEKEYAEKVAGFKRHVAELRASAESARAALAEIKKAADVP